MSARSKAAIVAAARTPIGTARRGTLADVSAAELAKPVTAAVVARSGVEPADFDDLVLAEVLQGGGDGARYIAVDLGLVGIPGLAVNRQCASSLSAVAVGAGQIASGMSRAILAGGMESCSTSPQLRKRTPFRSGREADDYTDWVPLSHPPTPDAPALDMSITVAHNCAVQFGITREEQDAWALRSHERAVKAIDAGSFVDEIVSVEVPQADGSSVTFAVDEHPRRGGSMDTLAGLKVLHPEIEGFSVTAGNSSGINDAAAVVALAGSDTTQGALAHILS
jgi:acetyl-CoA acetyltransferase family protein